MRHYALAFVLYTIAVCIVGAGINLDSPLPAMRQYPLGRIWKPIEVTPIQPAKVTAYCHCPICCGKWADGITASGTKATEGRTVAVDTSRWDMGACLVIPGLGNRIAEDTGSAIKGNRLDVYFDSHQDALEWGVKWLPVKGC